MLSSQLDQQRAPVAEWVKPWPTYLAVSGLILAGGRNIFSSKQGSIRHILHYFTHMVLNIVEKNVKTLVINPSLPLILPPSRARACM